MTYVTHHEKKIWQIVVAVPWQTSAVSSCLHPVYYLFSWYLLNLTVPYGTVIGELNGADSKTQTLTGLTTSQAAGHAHTEE